MRNNTVQKNILLLAFIGVFMTAGCAQRVEDEDAKPAAAENILDSVEVDENEKLGYLKAVDAEASSFDQTPDWAPEPDPMSAYDGDMLTRWSSDYQEDHQWIYFDFGQESVVSNVIIRWERAYARAYKIKGSNDADSWQVLYTETSSEGGTDEVSFQPVSCRYLKISGREKANPNWGISIWETEVYGPVSLNPHSTITKDEYLAEDICQEKIKQAQAALESVASPVIPLSERPFQKGLVYTSWMGEEFLSPVSDIMLAYLREVGFDSIAIMVPAYQETLYSDVVYTNDTPDGDTPTDDALRHVIASARMVGMRVMLKPHIDPRTDEPRINIVPSEAWFDSFEEFTLRYARLAAETNADIFCVGTELEATTFEAWTHRWEDIIEKVREVYDGVITYAANWTEFKEVPFWDKVDYIGIDAYFPLSNDEDPSLEELVDSWRKIADEIEEWKEERGLTGMGVVLTEIGYPSARGAARQPWRAISDEEDQRIQADSLEAVFIALSERPWFEGYYIWQYFPQERWSPLGFTVKGKKAESVINKWLENDMEM